jgi:xanthine dehydrogenase YagT iron-sulfur-binding subunit
VIHIEDEIAVGQRAPDIDLELTDGRRVRLSEFAGQPVVLAFSGEWDPSWPQQVHHYAAMLGNAQLLSISCDGALCQMDTEQGQVEFPVLHDTTLDGEAAKAFGVSGGQAVFVLDGEGVVRWKHVAPAGVHPTVTALRSALDSLGKKQLSRRQFLATAVAASLALAILPSLARADSASRTEGKAAQAGARTVTLLVNGESHRVEIDTRTSLLDALRERLGMTGTKKGCDHGQCGACTVHMDGRRVNSCLVLALQAEGAHITTVEGLAHGNDLHPVQEAFIKHDGYQCGYCTSGQIMSAVACIQEGHTRSDDEIREWMSGNICRCGAYPGIVAAVKEVAHSRGAHLETQEGETQ